MNTLNRPSPSLILVEDNETLREELQNYLSEEGFDVRAVDGGEALNFALHQRPADILVLDLNMAEEDGISIAIRIRKTQPSTRILMLTARVMSSDKQTGYESGADVYMTKPARPAELSAAIRNLSSRLMAQPIEAKWVLDTKFLNIRFQNMPNIVLTSTEVNMLKMLSLSPGCVSNETLQVLLQDLSHDNTKIKLRLEVLLSRLRVKLSPHTGPVNPIKPVRGRGYQLCMDLEIR